MNPTKKFGLVACALLGMTAAACAPVVPGEGEGPVDTVAPQVLAVDVAPLTVTPGQTFTISVTTTDDVGVAGVVAVARVNAMPVTWCGGVANLTSGTAQTGVWELQCTVPTVVNDGTYQINTLVRDERNNLTVIGDSEPNATSGHFTVSGGTSDSAAPAVQSVTVTPSTVAGGSDLTVTAHITDASGVKAVGFSARQPGYTPGFCVGEATLTSGTTLDGEWSLTCQVPTGTPAGSYTFSTLTNDVLDNIGFIEDAPAGPAQGAFTVTA